MRRAIVVLAVSLYAAIGLFAQQTVLQPPATHVVTKDATLSGNPEAVTIQLPATGARNVKIIAVKVYCSVACDYTLERDGTAATATSSTPTPVNNAGFASKATAFVDSDAGVGTVIERGTVNGYAQTYGRDVLPTIPPGPSPTGRNFTVRVASITGRAIISIFFREESY